MSDEKSPDWLPVGWSVELKVRKSGKKDKYYTDPVTGYVFRSLKDAHRYLKTGELGRLAFKPKESSRIDMDLEDDKLPSHTGAEGHKLADSGTNGQIIGNQSSKSVETVKDERVLVSTSTADPICISESAPEPCKEGTAASDANLLEPLASEQIEENSDSNAHMFVPAPIVATSPEKRPLENGMEGQGNMHLEIHKSNKKSKPGLPRRASKRLAGIGVDLPREPKIRRQATARQSGKSEEKSTAGLYSTEECAGKVETENSLGGKQVFPIVLPPMSLTTPEECGKKVETDVKPIERQELPIVLPPASLSIPEEHGGKIEMDDKPSERQEYSIVLPPASHSNPEEHSGKAEIDNKLIEGQDFPVVLPPTNLSTPEECGAKVESDIKRSERQELLVVLPRATISIPDEPGGKVEIDNNPGVKQELPPVSLVIPEERAGEVETDGKADVKPESPLNLSLMDLWTDPCIEFAVKTLTGAIPIVGDENKADDFPRPSSPLDLPLGELWTDPCIEFAVKTLTGAIPVGEDLSIQDYFQQHVCSSGTQVQNGFALQDVGLNNYCQTEILSQHFDASGNSLHKQTDLVVPMLPNNGHANLQNSGDSGLQHVKGRSGES